MKHEHKHSGDDGYGGQEGGAVTPSSEARDRERKGKSVKKKTLEYAFGLTEGRGGVAGVGDGEGQVCQKRPCKFATCEVLERELLICVVLERDLTWCLKET